MRKSRILILGFSFVLFSVIMINQLQVNITDGVIGYMTNNQDGLVLCFNEYDMPIRGIEVGGCTYFFIPSFINIDQLDYSGSDIRLYTESGDLLDKPVMNDAMDIVVQLADKSMIPYKVGFYKSENLYTMDIELDATKKEGMTKKEYVTAKMKMYSPQGGITYDEQEIRIKGRGNLTWALEKKPYDIRLTNEASLAGLPKSDRWTLLANALDPTKMKNRIAFDLSSIFGMEFTSESEWIDLYMNGEYLGNYQICHEPRIGHESVNITNLQKLNENFVADMHEYEDAFSKGYIHDDEVPYDISGGYLLEYIRADEYGEATCGFVIDGKKEFEIKSPDNALKEEVEYIEEFTRDVDRSLHESTGKEQFQKIDINSFAKRYLVEEIIMNKDSGFSSYYFYKKSGDDVMYAGPCWDYDKACGYGLGEGRDYNRPVLGSDEEVIDWDIKLLENKEYSDRVWSIFTESSDAMDILINDTIDIYYNKISASLNMDRLRWPDLVEARYDRAYDDIRYLKFFLYNRLQYLADMKNTGVVFNIPDIYESTEHQMLYWMEDGSQRIIDVKDGAQIETDEYHYYSKYPETLTSFIPVFEDMEVKCLGME